MAKIKMRATVPGSMDGFTTLLYNAGQEYQIDDSEINQHLADCFLNGNLADIVRERKKPVELAPEEIAVEESAPEVKEHPKPVELTEEETEVKSGESFEDSENEEDEEAEVDIEPKSTRVYALAKDLGTGWETIIEIANKLGIKVKAAASGLTDSQVKKIKADFEK